MKTSFVAHNKVRLRTLLRRFGLPPTCTDKEASDAYREIAKQVHPDLNKNADGAMFTLLQKDYDELKALLKAYPMSARRAGDFVAGFGSGTSGDHMYSGKKPSNPSEAQAQWAEQAMWEQKHRDRLRNFHPHDDRPTYEAPPVPLPHKLAVVGVFFASLYYGISWIAVFSSGRKCKQRPTVDDLNKAVTAQGQTREIKTMTLAEAQKRKIASTDPEYYARRFRKDTDHYESDKLKRYKDKEARKRTQGLNSRKTKTVLEGNPRGAYETSMKDFKRFMEEKAGSRKPSGERTGYSRGLGQMSTPAHQDRFRQPKVDVVVPMDLGKQVNAWEVDDGQQSDVREDATNTDSEPSTPACFPSSDAPKETKLPWTW